MSKLRWALDISLEQMMMETDLHQLTLDARAKAMAKWDECQACIAICAALQGFTWRYWPCRVGIATETKPDGSMTIITTAYPVDFPIGTGGDELRE